MLLKHTVNRNHNTFTFASRQLFVFQVVSFVKQKTKQQQIYLDTLLFEWCFVQLISTFAALVTDNFINIAKIKIVCPLWYHF